MFDPSQNWPTIDTAGTVTATGAAVTGGVNGNFLNLYLTWDIFPQPAEEVFDLDGLFHDPAGIFKVEVLTRCTPIPDTGWGTGMLLLMGMVGLGFWGQRMQSQFGQ